MLRTASLAWCAIAVCCAVDLSAEQAPGQRAVRPSGRQEPLEFTGAAKTIPPPPSPAMLRFAKSEAISHADKTKPETGRAAVGEYEFVSFGRAVGFHIRHRKRLQRTHIFLRATGHDFVFALRRW